MFASFIDGKVTVTVGDITEVATAAIVNAANTTLLGGGGVDGAIHAKGGPEILAECREIRRTRFPKGLPTGQAVMTTAGRLPARYVIHTVGPIYGVDGENQASQLGDCYRNSLELAAANQIESIAFPSISTGAYAYPADDAARVSSSAISKFLESATAEIRIRLVFFATSDADRFLSHHRF